MTTFRSLSLFVGADIVGPSLASDGTTRTVDEAEAVRQSLLSLLATRPGERVMRPLYGCDLYRLVFSPNDATTAGLAMHYARRAIERWEPRVSVVTVDARAVDETNLVVQLTYTRRGRNERESVSYTLQLAGGEP